MLCRRAILEARVAPEHFESGRYRPVLVQVPNKKPIVGTDPSCTFAHTVTVMIEIAITAVCARLDAISVEVNHNRRGAALGLIQIWALLVSTIIIVFVCQRTAKSAICLCVILNRNYAATTNLPLTLPHP